MSPGLARYGTEALTGRDFDGTSSLPDGCAYGTSLETLNDRTGTGTLTDRPSLRIFNYGTETLTGRAALRDGDGGAYGTSLLTGLLYLRDELTGQASLYGTLIITDGGASCRFLILRDGDGGAYGRAPRHS